jgi:hypothetical protein
MIVLTKLHHSEEQWAALAQVEDHGPVYMTKLSTRTAERQT